MLQEGSFDDLSCFSGAGDRPPPLFSGGDLKKHAICLVYATLD